jgi:hypothetical protein
MWPTPFGCGGSRGRCAAESCSGWRTTTSGAADPPTSPRCSMTSSGSASSQTWAHRRSFALARQPTARATPGRRTPPRSSVWRPARRCLHATARGRTWPAPKATSSTRRPGTRGGAGIALSPRVPAAGFGFGWRRPPDPAWPAAWPCGATRVPASSAHPQAGRREAQQVERRYRDQGASGGRRLAGGGARARGASHGPAAPSGARRRRRSGQAVRVGLASQSSPLRHRGHRGQT